MHVFLGRRDALLGRSGAHFSTWYSASSARSGFGFCAPAASCTRFPNASGSATPIGRGTSCGGAGPDAELALPLACSFPSSCT